MAPAGCATFDTLRVDRPELAEELVDLLTTDVHERLRHLPGFLRAQVVLGLDRTAAVIHCRWARESAGPAGDLGGRPGVVVTTFAGTETAGILGAATGAPPDVVAVATRHVDGPGAARELAGLLVRSGTWKRSFPGFVGATAFLSTDGRTYLNYPQWTGEAAYRLYMADPRIAEGQQEITRLETAPPEFVLGRVAADIGPPW